MSRGREFLSKIWRAGAAGIVLAGCSNVHIEPRAEQAAIDPQAAYASNEDVTHLRVQPLEERLGWEVCPAGSLEGTEIIPIPDQGVPGPKGEPDWDTSVTVVHFDWKGGKVPTVGNGDPSNVREKVVDYREEFEISQDPDKNGSCVELRSKDRKSANNGQ